MICPYCDSLLKETPESGTCPNCGAPLSCEIRQAQEKQRLAFPEPPLGIYENQLKDHIEITKKAIIFRTRIKLSDPLTRIKVVPYSKLIKVTIRPGSVLKAGYLSVLGEDDKCRLLPQRVWDAVLDDASITFNRSYYQKFYKVYYVVNLYSLVNIFSPDK